MIIKRISYLGWRGCVTVIGLGQIVINRIEHVGILCIGQSFFVLNGDICRRQWRLWSLAINLHRKLCLHNYNNFHWTQFRIMTVCCLKKLNNKKKHRLAQLICINKLFTWLVWTDTLSKLLLGLRTTSWADFLGWVGNSVITCMLKTNVIAYRYSLMIYSQFNF